MNWLITGGCGFIGRALIEHLLHEGGHAIRVLDNLSVGTREDLRQVTLFAELDSQCEKSAWAEGVALIEGDILDEGAVARAVSDADIVVHLAANTGVAPSVEDPMSDCRTNVIGTLNMLEACRRLSAGRFVFASSGAPLGVQVPPLHEEMAPHPASPYGASKLAGEGYCSAYYHCFGVETVVLRFGNVYGEGSGHKQSVVAKFIKQALAGERLEIYGDGTQTRDFIHISDLIDAIVRSATVSRVGGETFQVATAQETTVAEMTETLLAAMRAEHVTVPETFFGPKRDGDVMRNYSDTSKAKELLGWVSQVPLEDGLRRTIRYFVAADAA
ncbi:GDP-mannose 4,6-dehydratase [Psychromarinibacter sp. C21-152]|uniref:GDP-mannose 4,6-dehydratase n=1 Tax=Psychromarinibacter sediminicola TaxID=3033385 RepID=A0AAE3NNR9_9RHOB|nr:NAD-dependent epimerase/dehydratase family protein [Psychromarinibacter sediminicola]MDF0599281.1 GDP-mannose 4,6-dehydratase [Psychromarinibacter sediminicola]